MASATISQLTHGVVMAQRALDGIVRDMDTTLEESQVYIGLNDSVTREQKLETDRYVSVMKQVCRHFEVPFSFHVSEGGYIHDDGEYTEEKSIVLTFIDVPQKTVDEIARELCVLFHQESVLVTTDRIRMRSIREAL